MNFNEQATKFIEESQSRKRNPITRSTAVKYQSVLTNHILPIANNERVDEIGHRFGVVTARPAGYDDRIIVGSLG